MEQHYNHSEHCSNDLRSFAQHYHDIVKQSTPQSIHILFHCHFAEQCEQLRFDLDRGAEIERYDPTLYQTLSRAELLNQQSAHDIGSAIYYRWRQMAHGHYDVDSLWAARDWFLLLFSRLAELDQ